MYEYDSRVRFTEVGQDRRMTLMAILNAFQDCSTFHSEDLGVGMDFLEQRERMWVLRSWKMVIYRYPQMAEHIRVGTWPYEFGRLGGRRNFRLMDAEGRMAACADTEWVFMDMKKQRPARVDEEVSSAYRLEPGLSMEGESGRIRLLDTLEEKEPFAVHVRHLDVNHHVNNGQYVRLAEEYLPEDFEIYQMRAEYRKPAVLHDLICPRVGYSSGGCTVLLGDTNGNPYAVVEFKCRDGRKFDGVGKDTGTGNYEEGRFWGLSGRDGASGRESAAPRQTGAQRRTDRG